MYRDLMVRFDSLALAGKDNDGAKMVAGRVDTKPAEAIP